MTDADRLREEIRLLKNQLASAENGQRSAMRQLLKAQATADAAVDYIAEHIIATEMGLGSLPASIQPGLAQRMVNWDSFGYPDLETATTYLTLSFTWDRGK